MSMSVALQTVGPLVASIGLLGCTATIDGGSGPGTAVLTWTAPSSNEDGSALDLAGFNVYMGTAPGTYNELVDIGMASCQADGEDTVCTHTVRSLASGTWYFATSAYNSTSQESELSNEASKVVL